MFLCYWDRGIIRHIEVHRMEGLYIPRADMEYSNTIRRSRCFVDCSPLLATDSPFAGPKTASVGPHRHCYASTGQRPFVGLFFCFVRKLPRKHVIASSDSGEMADVRPLKRNTGQ